MQDTNINRHPVLPDWGPGPWEGELQPDASREWLLFTLHPGGYVKRVR